MRTSNGYASLLSMFIALLLPLFIILTPLYVFMNQAFVQFEYSQAGFPPSERFSADARYYNSVQTVRYVWGQISLVDLNNLGVYNSREIRHLVDVQNVARGALLVHATSGLLILAAFIALARSPLTRPDAARGLVTGAALTLVLIAGIGIFSVVAFDQFFVLFHHIFFEGDSWLFNYNDSLIQFYPEPFWEAASSDIALFVAGFSLIVGAVGWWWGKFLRRQAAKASLA